MKNFRTVKIQFLLVSVLAIVSSCVSREEVSITSLLNEMTDRDALASFPQTDFRLKQASSYNRASVSLEDSVGWFTNHDFNSNKKDSNFVRIEEVNGQKEWVLMDHQGPGVVVRTWMPFANPKTASTSNIIKIYLDGSSEPVLEGNMLGLLNGTGLFPFPLAHKSLRSAVSFFPIPYAERCKITVTERPFFYQFSYREYPEGTIVKTFTMEDYQKAEGQIDLVCKTLLNPENTQDGELVKLSESLASQEERSLILPQGTSAVRSFSLKLGSYADSLVLRSVILKMEFDGIETLWCPIGDFFGSGIGLNPFQGWYRTVSDDGTMSCRWVMPYKKTAKVSVLNLGKDAIDFHIEAVVGEYKWDKSSMYFNAAWRGENHVSTRPFSDWNYVTLKGRGVYVGDALTVYNPVKKWWGEGDEKIWVDGEDFPSIFGTGTEDYYGYSWGGMSTDFYEHPFHAQPRSHVYNKLNRKTNIGTRNTKGYSTETRTRALDVMPFGSSLQLDMEVWSWTDCDMAYGVGVYWYGDATTTSNRQADPEGAMAIYSRAQNPIINNTLPNFLYAADPAAEVFNGKVYVYCSHDQPDAKGFSSMQDYLVLESSDLKTWINHGVVLKPREYSWAHGQMNAPDVAYKDGWYYFYFPYDKTHIGVAKSKSPVGPWQEAVSDKITTIFDPCVFIDDDGQAYIYGNDHKFDIHGDGRHIMGAKLKDNMVELDGEWQRLSQEEVNEAVHVFKRNGKYYFQARVGKVTQYWMADEPLPKYANLIGELAPDAPKAPNHTSVIKFQDEWYFFYHRGDVNEGSFHKRSACFEKMSFRDDGTIEPIVFTLDKD